MTPSPFRGLGVALITPFKDNGEVDYPALHRLVNYQIDGGIDFIALLATTSEAPCLTRQEKKDIQAFVVQAVDRRIPILLACGGNCTAEVAAEAANIDTNGISGILSVAPFYNKPTQEGLYEHFHAIASATELPIVLYNVPSRTGVNIEPDTTIRLALACSNIVAIKEASGNMEQIADLLRRKPQTLDVLSGDDALTLDMIRQGAQGVISVIGNAMPRQIKHMLTLIENGEDEAASQLDHNLRELYRLLFADGNPAGIKALLHLMGYIDNVLRLPLMPMRMSLIDKMLIQMRRTMMPQ